MKCVKNKKIQKKIKIVVIPIFLICFGLLLEQKNKLISLSLKKECEQIIYNDAKNYYYGLYKEDKMTPKDDLAIEEIIKAKKKIEKIERKDKKEMLSSIKKLKYYLNTKTEINSLFDNGILKSNTNNDIVTKLFENIEKMPDNYKNILKPSLDEANNQLQYIKLVNDTINNLFTSEEKKEVKANITRKDYNNAVTLVSQLKQNDLKEAKKEYLKVVGNTITAREIAERKRREQEIRDAWVKLDIPYVSQNNPGVYNGCEAASLLMALKHKGYLLNMDLPTYATNMPKSDNPHLGFTYDIFSLEPKDVVHWIAPDALTSYGISSSGNGNIVNTTGYSLDQLDNELNNNNAIVIYLTANLKNPKDWIGETPHNMHVLLLSGYNKITKEHIITDPWTRKNGTYEWNISKKNLENLYNAVGKRSVTVK